MITAVDTNVLLDVLNDRSEFADRSAAAIRGCMLQGALIASEVMWAEVATFFPDASVLDDVMRRLNVVFVPMEQRDAVAAGRAWRAHRAHGPKRNRIVADFLIAAHAIHHADRLLTRDRGFFGRHFEGLVVLDPTA